MRVMETDTADNGIRQLKCVEENDIIRLTFQWPAAIGQVYIFKTDADFSIETASPKDARLFTLQEYKKQAGFTDRKTPGTHTYRVYPFIRDDGEDVVIVQSDGKNSVTCLTGQIEVQFSIREKHRWPAGDKVNVINLLSNRYIEEDVLCYVKKENSYPSDARDGTVYFFTEPLPAGQMVTRQVKTKKNEYIRLFICDPEKAPMYKLQMM